MSLNKVAISGNIGGDPELRTTSGGTVVLSFTVAVNDRVKDSAGNWTDRPNWVSCTVFGTRASSLSQYLHKGTKVAIEGKLRYSSWEKDGQRRSKLEVIVDEIEFMSQRQDAAPQAPALPPQPYPQQAYPPQQAYRPPQAPAPQWTAQQAYAQPPLPAQAAPAPQPAPQASQQVHQPQQAAQLVQPPEVYDEDIPF